MANGRHQPTDEKIERENELARSLSLKFGSNRKEVSFVDKCPIIHQLMCFEEKNDCIRNRHLLGSAPGRLARAERACVVGPAMRNL